MNLKQIYIDKRKVIEKATAKAVDTIYNSIENDPDYSLSTDENLELCEELIIRYCKGGYKSLNIK